jgi:hypothetical protein
MTLHQYISCWHASHAESAAMWGLYAERAGIAVLTTYQRLRSAIGEVSTSEQGAKNIYVGRVRYADYSTSFIPEDNTFDAFMHKRHSYEHEREVRLIVSEVPTRHDPACGVDGVMDLDAPSPAGVGVPVNLHALVAEIRVSPTAPLWMHEAVLAVTHRFGLDVAVRQSDLARDPVY